MAAMEGHVKWFATDKGYGYITGDDKVDYFVYYAEIVMKAFKDLDKGQRVSFTPKDTPKGLTAVDVRKIHGS